MHGADLAHAPQLRTLLEKMFKAHTIDTSVGFRAGNRGERGLRFADRVQQRYGIQFVAMFP